MKEEGGEVHDELHRGGITHLLRAEKKAGRTLVKQEIGPKNEGSMTQNNPMEHRNIPQRKQGGKQMK